MFTKGDSSRLVNCFKNGTMRYRFTSEVIKETVLKFNDINEKLKYYNGGKGASKHLQLAMVRLILREEYNHKRMLLNIDKNPDEFIKTNYYNNDENINRILIDKIYNKYHSKQNHLDI